MTATVFNSHLRELVTTRDAHLRLALQMYLIGELEQFEFNDERIGFIRTAMARVQSSLKSEAERLEAASDESDRAGRESMVESLSRTLDTFRSYEQSCRSLNAAGPVLPLEARRAYAREALNAIMKVTEANLSADEE